MDRLIKSVDIFMGGVIIQSQKFCERCNKLTSLENDKEGDFCISCGYVYGTNKMNTYRYFIYSFNTNTNTNVFTEMIGEDKNNVLYNSFFDTIVSDLSKGLCPSLVFSNSTEEYNTFDGYVDYLITNKYIIKNSTFNFDGNG